MTNTLEAQEELTVFTRILKKNSDTQCTVLYLKVQIDVIVTQDAQKVQLKCVEIKAWDKINLLKSLFTVTTVINVMQTVLVNAALFSQGLWYHCVMSLDCN